MLRIKRNHGGERRKKWNNGKKQLILYEYLPASNNLMTTASWGRRCSLFRVAEPRRSISVLATNTPVSGKLTTHAGSMARSSGPRLSRMRKWTQPQERRKARTG